MFEGDPACVDVKVRTECGQKCKITVFRTNPTRFPVDISKNFKPMRVNLKKF